MDGGSSEGSEGRFAAYVEALGAVLGHVDRQQPMHDYCLGLLMPLERKSVKPMAAVTGTGAGRREASILASFCRKRAVVGRRDAGQGERTGVASD
jgi:SRSO17 transposase